MHRKQYQILCQMTNNTWFLELWFYWAKSWYEKKVSEESQWSACFFDNCTPNNFDIPTYLVCLFFCLWGWEGIKMVIEDFVFGML